MLKTIRLYGELGAKFGRVHRLAVDSAAEAVRALCSQIKGFEAHLTQSKDRGISYAVFLGKRNLTEENLREPAGNKDIRIAPMIKGSKSKFFNLIAGVVLVVVGAVIGIFFGWTGIGGVVGGMMVKMGVAMIVGGVVQLLMPAPKGPDNRDRPDDNASYVFNGPVNTQAQGNPVPLLYGRMTVGSAVISAGIRTGKEQLAGTPPATYTGGGSFSDMMAYVLFRKAADQAAIET